MCPGLTSPGGKMDDVDKDKPVVSTRSHYTFVKQ
jgi:hypothetical protein